jgi:hypothetical protein
LVRPDVFIDNHVSNGADYQYVLTHLFTQHNKLGGELGEYLHKEMMPKLEQKLAAKNWDISPYVNVFNDVPEKGFSQFMDYPRYSTGYTTLFNTLGMMVETHMLKPYQPRVEGTYELMKSMIEICEEDHAQIKDMRQNAIERLLADGTYALDWEVDTARSSTLRFKGYEADLITSGITGTPRLKYDPNRPFTKDTEYRNYFKPRLSVDIPNAYIIPQGWHEVVELLTLNGVDMTRLERDSIFDVEAYKINHFETRKSPYEGHYLHYQTQVIPRKGKIAFREGDWFIPTHQPALRYLLATLEPQAPDSFFNWNFFDTILQQKEGFSPYVWEDKAAELLKENEALRTAFETKKNEDEAFANSWYAQLDWLHKQSEHYEKAHLQYPVYRVFL